MKNSTPQQVTLRDWYQGMASIGLLVAMTQEQQNENYLKAFDGDEKQFDKWIAKRSSEIAASQIAERNKP